MSDRRNLARLAFCALGLAALFVGLPVAIVLGGRA